ncbi:UPF0481 protein [Nymphaea thermarum]|nr:UPF0481 protein [Nymphaea thermarum]
MSRVQASKDTRNDRWNLTRLVKRVISQSPLLLSTARALVGAIFSERPLLASDTARAPATPIAQAFCSPCAGASHSGAISILFVRRLPPPLFLGHSARMCYDILQAYSAMSLQDSINEYWYPDTGATNHIVASDDMMHNKAPQDGQGNVMIASLSDAEAEGGVLSSRIPRFVGMEQEKQVRVFMVATGSLKTIPKHPHFLGIGPYHSKNPSHTLEDTVLNLVLERTQICRTEDVVNALRDDALRVRERYEGADIGLYNLPQKDEFVNVLVRDGCLVLELMHIMTTVKHPFRTIATRFSSAQLEFPLNNTMQRHILLDVLRVDNQIPMAFLQSLYSHLQYRDQSFEAMLNKFLGFLLMKRLEVPNLAGSCHLLDAARMKFLPSMVGDSRVAGSATGACLSPFGEMSVRYSAIDLEDSRVTISLADEGMVKWGPRPSGIPFLKPFLKLPHILINRDSECIFRNMVGYEQRLVEDDDQPVSSYLRLLSDLVLTAADARVLTFQGIIDNQLGSLEDVVKFFRDLDLGRTYGIDMLSNVRKDINTHCGKKWIFKLADLRHTYFRSPWSYCSLAAALILLILTILQVLYAMLAYHLPKST